MTDKYYVNKHFEPDYVRENPIVIQIISLDQKFDTLWTRNLVRGSIKLTQTLCGEEYLIWGGFNASRLEFECWSTSLVDNPPDGQIQLVIIPTAKNSTTGVSEQIESERTALFTGYIEEVEPDVEPGHWKCTAYDRLYRVRNNNVVDWLQSYINGHKQEGTHISWYDMEAVIAVSQLGLHGDDRLPEWTKSLWYPDNNDITTENGVDLLREFALCCGRFGILNGEGRLEYIRLQDSTLGEECYRINTYDQEKFSRSDGHVWLPKLFTTEPRTNLFYSSDTGTSEDDYYNNTYTISNFTVIGDQEWINEQYGCDEYGTPSSKWTKDNMPPQLYDPSYISLLDSQENYCQEYKITVFADPTIPMGSILKVYKSGILQVRSYIIERTVTFTSTQTIECTYSAHNAPYNSVVPELDYGVRSANAKANQANSRLPFIADGSSLTKLRAIKSLSKTEYQNLKEKRDDTIYYVYDDGGSAS